MSICVEGQMSDIAQETDQELAQASENTHAHTYTNVAVQLYECPSICHVSPLGLERGVQWRSTPDPEQRSVQTTAGEHSVLITLFLLYTYTLYYYSYICH